MQPAGGRLLPPVQKLVASIILLFLLRKRRMQIDSSCRHQGGKPIPQTRTATVQFLVFLPSQNEYFVAEAKRYSFFLKTVV